MKITKLLLTAVISVMLLSTCALALGDDVIVDMGPIFGELVEVIPGDINDDGAIDAKDVSLLGTILATGGDGFTTKQLASANLYTEDDNGTQALINIKDLIALAQCVHVSSFFEPQKVLSNLAIPVKDENGNFLKTEHNGKEGLFVHVLKDSSLLWLELDEEYVHSTSPDITYEFCYEEAYLDKLCSMVELSDGKYMLISLSYNENRYLGYAGINKDEAALSDTSDTVRLYIEDDIHRVSTHESIGTCFRTASHTSKSEYDFAITDDTIIVIKNIENKGKANEETEYIIFDKASFNTSLYTNTFVYNAAIILQNNPEGNVENALVIYASAEDYSSETRTERIISSSEVARDGSTYYNYYTAFNPYTGEKETGLCGSFMAHTPEIATGAIPTGTKAQLLNDAIYENSGYKAEDVINPESDFVWVIGYNLEEKSITVLPEGSEDTNDAVTYTYTDSTCLSMLSHYKKADLFKWGIMNPVDPDDFYENLDSKAYRCYNNKIPDGEAFTTKYAKYIKAYISPIENTDVIDYAIVIVHGNEAVENLNT